MKAKIYNMQGEETGEMDLPAGLFEIPVIEAVVHEVVRGMMTNRRVPIAHTKTRGEVSGGGRKPWRQKGTGRARHGSTRSPIWVGGGITFGPRKTRNFKVKINKKTRRQVIRMAFSDKAGAGKILLLEGFAFESGKTKDLLKILTALPVGKKTLFIVGKPEPKLVAASRNLQQVHTVTANAIDLIDLLRYETLLMPKEAISVLEKTYGISR